MIDQTTLLLSQSQIKQLIHIRDVNKIIDSTFRGLSQGTVINPSKVSLDLGEHGDYPHHNAFINAMPAYIGSKDVAGLKWIGGFEDRRNTYNLSYLNALITLVDPTNGHFLSVMDGEYISALRTGSQAAVALTYLWERESVDIGLYGAGRQARATIQALAELIPIRRLIVWNHRLPTAQKFKDDMQKYVQQEIEITTDGSVAAKMPVLMTLTPSQNPIIRSEWINPGTIIMPMGSYQEIEDDIILKSDAIYVDHIDQSLNRGALKYLHSTGVINKKHITGTFGDIATGICTANIQGFITLAIPIGTGAMDIAVATEIYLKAKRNHVGTYFDFSK